MDSNDVWAQDGRAAADWLGFPPREGTSTNTTGYIKRGRLIECSTLKTPGQQQNHSKAEGGTPVEADLKHFFCKRFIGWAVGSRRIVDAIPRQVCPRTAANPSMASFSARR